MNQIATLAKAEAVIPLRLRSDGDLRTPAAECRIARVHVDKLDQNGPVLSLGFKGLDQAFKVGGLASGSHQAAGTGAATAGFAATLLARLHRCDPDAQALIVQEADARREYGAVYAPGLAAMGVDPDRVALASIGPGVDALRVADEALKSRAFAAVVLELRRGEGLLDLGLTRRFNLAARAAKSLALLLTPTLDGTSAALTRWVVELAPSVGPQARHIGRPTFRLDLVRNRAGPVGAFSLEWDSDACAFRPPSIGSLAVSRPVPPDPARLAAASAGGRGLAAARAALDGPYGDRGQASQCA